MIFLNGCFDIIHAGHIDLLKKASEIDYPVIIGINSDESVRKLKGEGRPINKLEDRIKVLESIKYVNLVYSFDEETPLNLIKQLHPWIIMKGGDYKAEDVVGYRECQAWGGSVVIFPYKKGYSTTDIICKIKQEKV